MNTEGADEQRETLTIGWAGADEISGLVGDQGGDEGTDQDDGSGGGAGHLGIDQVTPPGASHAVAADGCDGDETERNEALEVEFAIIKPGAEAGEVEGKLRNRCAAYSGIVVRLAPDYALVFCFSPVVSFIIHLRALKP